MGFTAWFPGVPLRRKQPATGGEGPGSIRRHPHQMSPLPFAAEKAVAQKVQQGRTPVSRTVPASRPPPLNSPASRRGWRTKLLMRASVAEKTSSSRSRAASSGLHMARVPDSGPENQARLERIAAMGAGCRLRLYAQKAHDHPTSELSKEPMSPQRGVSELASDPCSCSTCAQLRGA